MSAPNSREENNETTKQMIAEFDEESNGNDLTQKIVGLLGIHGVAVKFEGYSDASHITKKFVEVIHQELQKAHEELSQERTGFLDYIRNLEETHKVELQKARESVWDMTESVIQQEAKWCKDNGKTKGELDFLKGVQQALWLVQKARSVDQSELDQPTDTN